MLQQTNLYRNVSTEEKLAEGFVTVEHTYELLDQMHKVCSHSIAKDELVNLASSVFCENYSLWGNMIMGSS